MFKKKSAIYLIIVTLVVLLVLTSCDARKGTLNANLQPYITITNYFGVESDSLLTESHLFQQTVQWSGTDDDGVVEGYAFRVLNEDGVAIATAGYDAIDENGWVKFYTSNADQSIPLNQSAQTTIWMDQSYATINFPAADANGDSANVISLFEVKCIDNSGTESDIASKYFQAHSNTPRAMIISNIDGETISTAIVFEFAMSDEDPYVGDNAYNYEYKLEMRDLNNVIIPESAGGYNSEWLSTLGFDDVTLALHSGLNGNALIPNTLENSVPQNSTFLRVKAIDTALIESDEIEISFNVKEGFYPGTVIYFGDDNGAANAIYSLGSNHFATYLDENISDILPSVQTSDGAHFATPFWYDAEGKYTAIGSNDIKTYLKWGYNGEYELNNPHKRREDKTIDELTEQEYYCEVIGYDIRLDEEPYYYPPIPAEGDHLQVDDDGKEWLRVYVNDAIEKSTTVTLTSYGGSLDNLYGEHIFEVRAIDLQGAVDLTPHVFTYSIIPPILKEEKSGILIIDDEGNTPNSPGELVDSLYTYYVSSYDTEPGYINREELYAFIGANAMGGLHFAKSIIAPSDIQQYKTIIYHSDNGAAEFDFWKEFETLKIYLSQGGNMIISGGGNFKTLNIKLSVNGFGILEDYFGIPMNGDTIDRVSSSYLDNPFFIKAISEDGYNDIDLLLPSFNSTITNPMAPFLSVNGLGPVAYFNNPNSEVIFTYGCKEVADDPPGCPFHINPTQEEYDEFNGLPIALKYETANNSCYIFGFPLAYMEPDQVKSMMTQILNDLP
ncbi:MAG: hypothetical protein HQ554_06345 [FCB group bacterium]|nr:hypothetical protein [FCB group bacterium]